MAFRFILAPEAGFLAFVNQIWPGLWNPALDGIDAMICIIVAFAWKYVGYNFIFFLAALQAIPRSLIEAAAMDGAGIVRRMRDIQLPLLTPTLFFLLVINLTDSFTDSFGIVDIMTQGGPARATELMVYKIYFDGFKGLDYSGAAAQSIILMLLVIVLTIVAVPLSSSGASTTSERRRWSSGRRSSTSSRQLILFLGLRRRAGAVRHRRDRRHPRSAAPSTRCRCRSCPATISWRTSPRPGQRADLGRKLVNS